MADIGQRDTAGLHVLSETTTPRRVRVVPPGSEPHETWDTTRADSMETASLRDLHRLGLPVPPGFEVTGAAYREFMGTRRLFEVAEGILAAADPADQAALERATQQVRRIMMNANMPGQLYVRIRAAYESLGQGPVMVRLSRPAERFRSARDAGGQTEFRNVHGIGRLLHAIRTCWATCFDPAGMAPGVLDHQAEHARFPVLSVQKMLNADASGLLYTQGPVAPCKDVLRIEAIYGLSAPLLEGRFAPDVYYVDRSTQRVLASSVTTQMRMLQMRKSDRARAWVATYTTVTSGQNKPKLSDIHAHSLARMALRLERQYGYPQTVEWVLAEGQVFVLQAWPTAYKDRTSRTGSALLVGQASG